MSEAAPAYVILHSVFLRLHTGHDGAELLATMTGLEALCVEMAGCVSFKHGPNLDAENKSPDYPYGFVVSFETSQDLAAYAANATHKALGARLCALCQGGGDGIMVYDLEVAA